MIEKNLAVIPQTQWKTYIKRSMIRTLHDVRTLLFLIKQIEFLVNASNRSVEVVARNDEESSLDCDHFDRQWCCHCCESWQYYFKIGFETFSFDTQDSEVDWRNAVNEFESSLKMPEAVVDELTFLWKRVEWTTNALHQLWVIVDALITKVSWLTKWVIAMYFQLYIR